MPINLPVPEPEPEAQAETTPAVEPPKRKRRSKEEMIAAARIPADDEQVELKDGPTGAKIQRPWLVALEMVRERKATFADNEMKHAMTKYDRQKGSSALEEGAARPISGELHHPTPEEAISGGHEAFMPSSKVPSEAEVGDEIVIGADTFRLGHGGALVDDFKNLTDEHGKPIPAARRWQRELGAGADGPWESVKLQSAPAEPESNGKGEIQVETERLPHTQEPLDDGAIKIGTGVLEKIGMPDYSSFQIGPITISRTVFDDGRRTAVTFDDGREGEIITAAAEGYEVLDNTIEFIAKRFRGQLVSFLEANGALKQPVS